MKKNIQLPESAIKYYLSALLLIAIPLLFPYLGNIEYQSNIEDYFSENEKSLVEYQSLKSSFHQENSLLLVISAISKQSPQNSSPTLFNKTTLRNLYSFLTRIESFEYVDNTSSIFDTTLLLHNSDEQQNITLRQYLFKTDFSDISTNSIIYGKLSDNLSGSSFWLSSNNKSTVIEVLLSDKANPQKAYQHLMMDIHSNRSELTRFKVQPWGGMAIKAALNQSLLHDGIYLFPATILIGVILLYFFISSFRLIIAGIISIIVALALTFELAGVMGVSLNQTSVMAFGIVFIISLADVIHVLMCYQSQHSLGMEPNINRAIRYKLQPLCLTTLTTCIGFLSLDVAGSPTFSTFGLIAATGVVFALITTLFLLPATIELWGKIKPDAANFKKNNNGNQPPRALQQCINYFHVRVDVSKPLVMVVLVFTTFVICSGILKNTYHNDSLTYFSETSDIRQATRKLELDFDTHQGIAVMLSLTKHDDIYSPEITSLIDKFHHWLSQQSWVGIHTSYVHTLTNIHRGIHENDFRWHSLPRDESHIAELFSLYEMASDKNTLSQLGINKNKATVLISVGIPERLNSDVLMIRQSIEEWFSLHSPSTTITVSGQGIVFASVGWNLTQQLLMGAALTISIITILIGLVFRNASIAILSIIPNVLPALVCIGAVGWLSGKVNFAIAGSISIALGIVVDDTIHILSDYVRLRRKGSPPHQSIRSTLITTGPALLLTTLVLTAGFCVLNFAIFVPNQHTAKMITAMISSAILYDFILLPYLLTTFDRWIFPLGSTATNSPAIMLEHG